MSAGGHNNIKNNPVFRGMIPLLRQAGSLTKGKS